jgi:excisionase family DNA binding protein
MTSAETERLLAPCEVALRLHCSPVTVYRAISRGELEARRLGKRGSLRVTEQALDEFLRPAHSSTDEATRT